MRFSILRNLILSVFIITVFLLSCGDENPQGLEEDEIVTVDTIPPSAVTGLYLESPTTSAISLVWIAPGDDGTAGQATAYDIRYATSVITELNWAAAIPVNNPPAPKPAGQLETMVVPGLSSVTDYYFALKALDEVPNLSAISNCPDTTTLQEFTAPSPVSDLEGATLSDSELLLTWTAPGDDGFAGTAASYDIRYSYFPLTVQNWATANRFTGEPAPNPGGEPDSFLVIGFPPDSSFYYGMKTADEVPNWSLLSNTPLVLGHQINLEVVPSTVINQPEVVIYFKASTPRVSIKIWRSNPWGEDTLFRSLVWEYFTPGPHTIIWDLKSDSGTNASSWNYRVELKWGTTLIAEKIIRVV